jgi:polyisoprenyl-phosphate glycosyltransferase
MNSNSQNISVIIPVYNSEDCLDELSRKLSGVLDSFGKVYEIILVNDCSQDNSWGKIIDLCGTNDNVKGINLRKNFGVDNAIMAGVKYAQGKIIILMDDDLQHDPADIPTLISGLNKGYDVCYANFTFMKQSWLKNLGSWFNDKVANVILDKPKGLYLSAYKAIKREVIDEIIKYSGPYPYVDGLILRVTQRITQECIQHHKRFSGKGNYNLIRSIRIWLKMATNFSVFPLRIATFLGFISTGISFILSVILLFQYLVGVEAPPGWFTLVMIVIFIGGIQLFTVGIIGEYVGRLFLHFSKKPQFVVSEIISGSDSKNLYVQTNILELD